MIDSSQTPSENLPADLRALPLHGCWLRHFDGRKSQLLVVRQKAKDEFVYGFFFLDFMARGIITASIQHLDGKLLQKRIKAAKLQPVPLEEGLAALVTARNYAAHWDIEAGGAFSEAAAILPEDALSGDISPAIACGGDALHGAPCWRYSEDFPQLPTHRQFLKIRDAGGGLDFQAFIDNPARLPKLADEPCRGLRFDFGGSWIAGDRESHKKMHLAQLLFRYMAFRHPGIDFNRVTPDQDAEMVLLSTFFNNMLRNLNFTPGMLVSPVILDLLYMGLQRELLRRPSWHGRSFGEAKRQLLLFWHGMAEMYAEFPPAVFASHRAYLELELWQDDKTIGDPADPLPAFIPNAPPTLLPTKTSAVRR